MQNKNSDITAGGGNKDTSWGKVAEWYDDLLSTDGDSYQAQVILPNLTRRLAPKKGMAVLDLACGQGFFTREWVKAGATVVASDIAAPLITLAQKQSPVPSAYHIAPAHDVSFVQSGTLDAVTIILALQNIENLSAVCAEVSRVLKPGGIFYIVLNHPAFRIPKQSSWEWDKVGKAQYRRIDAYMTESRSTIDMNPGTKELSNKEHTVSFHRPLQVYAKLLGKAGFGITHIEEWISHKMSKPGPRAEEENRTRKEIPMFLLLEATKIK
ncbi:MAG: class I SAM-dependent methyltransferase [Candidatus Taylorbacteria bacterium]|nr:class I SAM-dependent methyltransferase [Candidatus Taylorbacteria bacterium]